MPWTFRRLVFGALALAFVSAGEAGPGPYQDYYILRHADYEAATGCSVSASTYVRSLQAATDFLVFEGARSKQNTARGYARRHTRPLFADLRYKYPATDGFLEERCMHPSLRRIAVALGMLDAQGRFPDPTSGHKEHVGPDSARYANDPVDAGSFPIIARDDYSTRTGCGVSADSYKGYAAAFDWVVFGGGYEDRARDGMRVLLDELAAASPSDDGGIATACMIPAITKIAAVLGLLDAHGRYILQK